MGIRTIGIFICSCNDVVLAALLTKQLKVRKSDGMISTLPKMSRISECYIGKRGGRCSVEKQK